VSMRVLVIGGAGMLGHKLVQRLGRDFDSWTTLRGTAASVARYGIFDADKIVPGVDVHDFDTVVGAVARVRPQAIVNCVGIIKQLAAARDPVPSLTINSLLPHRLQSLAAAAGARLVHISTDCVFSGRKGMYTEDDPSDALDLYGRTKFLGEAAGPGALTLRTSIIGRELAGASGLVEWFLSQRGGRVEGYTRAIYTGFTTEVLARVIASVLRDHEHLHGTLQVSSAPIDKCALLRLLDRAYGTHTEIVPSDRVAVDRSLDSSRFRALTGFAPPSWQEMIDEMAADPTPYDAWRQPRP
jgi:dTDP-4-dehydrorhamnose reductase